jgi:hypothetical protein
MCSAAFVHVMHVYHLQGHAIRTVVRTRSLADFLKFHVPSEFSASKGFLLATRNSEFSKNGSYWPWHEVMQQIG